MNTRNDKKGRLPWGRAVLNGVTFYASGQQGPEVRADGRGGLLERGYYARYEGGRLVGPVSCRSNAVSAAQIQRHFERKNALTTT